MTHTYKLVCPFCGNKTPHTIVFSTTEEKVLYSKEGFGSVFDLHLLLLKCPTCNRHSLRENIDIETEKDIIESHVIYPNKKILPKEVPEKVKELYPEAERIKHISPKAYAVLMRIMLESICIDKNAEGKNLFEKLNFLEEKKIIPPILGDASDILRKIGNIGAHAGEEISEDLISTADFFFNVLVDYLYVIPKKINKSKKKLNG